MRKVVAFMVVFTVAAVLALAGVAPMTQAAGTSVPASPLPVSLNSFYPPSAPAPLYLINMIEMETLFSGIAVDVMENDLPNARKSFDQFKARYLEVANMVPEWKAFYPVQPVDKLGAQLATGDPGSVMAAFGEVGNVCHQCHISTMVPVQQRYHWGDFAAVKVGDPLTKEPTGFALFKKFLSTNMAGITVNLRQGQAENARRQYEAFSARFQALKESCESCHAQERGSYVDASVETQIKKLGEALKTGTPDAAAVGSLIQRIGQESCSKCHLVHLPAAMAAVKTP